MKKERKPPPPWLSPKPKPNMDEALYGDNVEELARYIDWHGRNPRCSTPVLKVGCGLTELPPIEQWTEDNPNLVITHFPTSRPTTLPKEIFTSAFKDGDFDGISVAASNLEFEQHANDPWCDKSVQSGLFLSHMDLSPRSLSMTSFEESSSPYEKNFIEQKAKEKEVRRLLRAEQAQAEKAKEHEEHLQKLSLYYDKEQSLLARKKGGLWVEAEPLTQFTSEGTVMAGYLSLEREILVREALTLYFDELESSGVRGIRRRGCGDLEEEMKASSLTAGLSSSLGTLGASMSSLFGSGSPKRRKSAKTSSVLAASSAGVQVTQKRHNLTRNYNLKKKLF